MQATRAQEAGNFERIDFEMVLSLEGAGLSVVDNDRRMEIAYLGVTRYACTNSARYFNLKTPCGRNLKQVESLHFC